MPGTKTFVSGDVLTAADMNSYARGGLVMAYATRTVDISGITTVADLTDMSVTFTAVTGRLYMISAHLLVRSTVANDWATIYITDGSNNSLQVVNILCPSTTLGQPVNPFILKNPGAGSVTYKLRAQRTSGTGNIAIDANATYPISLVAIDIGVA